MIVTPNNQGEEIIRDRKNEWLGIDQGNSTVEYQANIEQNLLSSVKTWIKWLKHITAFCYAMISVLLANTQSYLKIQYIGEY